MTFRREQFALTPRARTVRIPTHGEKDTLVPVQQSELFYDALKKAGVEAHLVIVPGQGHGIIAPPDAAQQIYQFFDRQLKPNPSSAMHLLSQERRNVK